MERNFQLLRLSLFAAASLALSFSAAAASPPLEAYGNLPQVEFMRVSPSGNRIAMIGVDHEKRQLILAEAGTNKVLKAAAVGDNKVRNLFWAGDEHVLVEVTKTSPLLYDYGYQRIELFGMLHVGLDGSPPWPVFGHSDSIEHTVFGYSGAYPQQGRWYGYFRGLTLERQRGFGDAGYTRQHSYLDLYQVDLQTSTPKLLATGPGREHEWVIGADGNIAAHVEFAPASGEWVLYAGREREKLLIKKNTPVQEISLVGLGRRDGTVLVLDHTGDTDQVCEIEVATGACETLFSDVGVTGFLYDPLSGLLIGAATPTDPWAQFFDPALQKHYNSARKAFPNQQVRLESFSPNLKDMIVFTDGTADSGTFWFVNGTTHRADPIGYPYAQIAPTDVGPVKTFGYSAADGLRIEAILTLPPGREPKRLPLVVLPHGGPISAADQAGFDWWAQAFASQGYAVLQPNYRGTEGYSDAFRRAGFGEWGRKILSDIADGVTALGTQSLIDPKRVCIVGASYGGYAALAGVTMQRGLYRCAVSVSGPSDMAKFMNWQTTRYGLDSPDLRYMRKLIGADSASEDRLREISPAHFVKQAEAPILLIHGKDDTRVPIEQSRDMAAALKRAGKVVQLVELEHEDHFLSRDATRIAMLKAAVDFVSKFNPP
jgi:dipeptidyl aminopeptidase/acylaminoacyl peptidase